MAADRDYISLNTWAILDELNRKHTASDFGRINQALLSIAFQHAGFVVSHYQGTGRPDFIADRKGLGYALEVKAPPSEKVTLSAEDISGIENLGKDPILAVLLYPLLDAGWLLMQANRLSPGSYDKSSLARMSMRGLEDEINSSFLVVLEEHKEKAIIGASALQALVEGGS